VVIISFFLDSRQRVGTNYRDVFILFTKIGNKAKHQIPGPHAFQGSVLEENIGEDFEKVWVASWINKPKKWSTSCSDSERVII
jgi:hypothetical protein